MTKAPILPERRVSVVGFACRMPGAPDVPSFWSLLDEGRCTISPEGSGRWNNEQFLHPRPGEPGRSYTFASGVLPDIYAFDHAAFGLSPREVEQMDPQQRILLELTREALDDMNWPASSLAGKSVGVFVGASSIDHMAHFFSDISAAEAHFVTGSALSIIANRISHIYGFTGPSFTIDTACSSSLVAFDRAVKAIEHGEIDTAIVGSVNILASPFNFIGFSRAGMLSPTGLCRPFSAAADGYVRSEGAAVLVLRRSDEARAAGQRARAVVMGSGVNSDGHTVGIVFPATKAQQNLVEQIYAERAIDVDALSFVEAHGTGTRVGDPAEASAIGHAIGRKRAKPLPIGSVKSNIGHLEPASGLAGMIKAMLAMEHRRLPASLHLETLNETIPFADLNLAPAHEAVALTETGGPLSAGISSFGFGGTNAHVAIRMPTAEEAPEPGSAVAVVPVLALSAHSRPALAALARSYAERLTAEPTTAPALARATAYGRDLFDHRLVMALDGPRPPSEQLAAFAADEPARDIVHGRAEAAVKRVAFVFAGNGSQFVGMGRAAYRGSATFRSSIDALDRVFEPLAGWSLAAALEEPADAARLAATAVAQPLIFAIEVAIAESLIAAGCRPAIVLGHSVGEIAAAHVAGGLDREDAVRLVHWRSRCQERTRGFGSMTAVMQSPEDAGRLIRSLGLVGTTIAAINSPAMVTVAGPTSEMEILSRAGRGRRIAMKPLGIDYPFHSDLMEPIRAELAERLADLRPRAGAIPFVSTVTGGLYDPHDLGADYWWNNVRQPVRFRDAVQTAAAEKADLFLEIGPRPILASAIRDSLSERGSPKPILATLDKDSEDAGDPIARIVMTCFVHGVPIDRATLFGPAPVGDATPLPSYPWQRVEVRPPTTSSRVHLAGTEAPHPLLGGRLTASSFEWLGILDAALVPYLADHRVNGLLVVPGAALAEMVLAVGREMFGDEPLLLEDFDIVAALVLREPGSRETLVRASNSRTVEIFSRERGGDEWALHARGRVGRSVSGTVPMAVEVKRPGRPVKGSVLYDRAATLGLEYGPQFRLVRTARRAGATIALDLKHPDASQGSYRMGHVLHPVSLDAAFHGLLMLVDPAAAHDGRVFLPVRFGRLDVRRGGLASRAIVRIKRATGRSILADFTLLGADGSIVATLEDARFRWTALSGGAGERPTFVQRFERFGAGPIEGMAALLSERFGKGDVAPEPSDDRILLQAFAQAVALDAVDALAEGENTTIDVDATVAAGRVAAAARPLLSLLLQILAQAGVAEEQHGLWRIDADATLPDPDQVLRALVATAPDRAAEIAFASRIRVDLDLVLRTGKPLVPAAGMLDQFMTGSPTFAGIAEPISGLCDDMVAAGAADRVQILLVESRGTLARALMPAVRARTVRLTVHDPLAIGDRAGRKPTTRLPGVVVGLDEADRLGTRFDLVVLADAPGTGFGLLKEAVSRLRPGAPVLAVTAASDAFTDLVLATMPDGEDRTRLATMASRSGEDLRERLGLAGVTGIVMGRTGTARAGFDVVAGHVPHPVSANDDIPTIVDTVARWLGSDDDLLELDGHRTWLHKASRADRSDASEALASRIERAAAVLGAARDDAAVDAVWLIAHGTQPTGDTMAEDAGGAAFWGFGRVAMNEYADLDLRLIEAGDPDLERAARTLVDLLAGGPAEREIVIAADGLHALRASLPGPVAGPRGEASAAVLDMPAAGSLNRLAWRPALRRAPGRGEVEVEVAASALNFRDVMFAQGLLGDDMLENGFAGATLGFECSGTIVRVGEAVRDLQPGTRVMAFAPSAFGTHVTVSARAVVGLPDALDLVAAATMPVAFITVWYGLHHLARLKRGETVLIHGAAGGVGMAAIQVARIKGAVVIATAGSPEKRALARTLGATHVFDSRSQAFAEDVARTIGGVDVVLNSLAGEAMERSLKLLKPFGRFVELGKRDYVTNSEIGLRPFARNLTYFGVDADQLIAADPQLLPRMFRVLRRFMDQGSIRPLPYRLFQADDAPDAFRLMQGGGHVGKILVRPPETAIAPDRAGPFRPAADGVHIVIGGTSGFGFETAAWLAENGAGTVVVASRSGRLAADARAHAARLRKRRITILVETLDVADREATIAFVDRMAEAHGPVRGVVHAAMVLNDGLIRDLDPDRLRATLDPKVRGALNLDAATRRHAPDYFVLYSSATTLIGNPGQAGYVAANSFLESLARNRRRAGLPALAVGWGPITDAGVLARDAAVNEKLKRRIGAIGLRSREALGFLGRLLAGEGAALPAAVTYAPLDFAVIAELQTVKTAAFADLMLTGRTTPDAASGVDLAAMIAGKTDAEAQALLGAELGKEIARILHVAPGDIDHTRPLTDLGMDSLMGLELEMEVQRRFGVQLPMLSLSAGASLFDVTGALLKRLRSGGGGDDEPADENVVKLALANRHLGRDANPEEVEKLGQEIEAENKRMRSGGLL